MAKKYPIDILQDENGNIIRPATVSDNVVNPETGNSVTEDLGQIALKVNEVDGVDPATYTYSGYPYTTTGGVKHNYIPVSLASGQKFKFAFSNYSGIKSLTAYVSADGVNRTSIGGVITNGNPVTTEFTCPIDAKFVSFFTSSTNVTSDGAFDVEITVEGKEGKLDILQNEIGNNAEDIKNTNKNIDATRKQVTEVLGGIVEYSYEGYPYSTSAGVRHTNISVDIKNGEKFKFAFSNYSGVKSLTAYVSADGVNRTSIGGVITNGTPSTTEFTSPIDAKFISFFTSATNVTSDGSFDVIISREANGTLSALEKNVQDNTNNIEIIKKIISTDNNSEIILEAEDGRTIDFMFDTPMKGVSKYDCIEFNIEEIRTTTGDINFYFILSQDKTERLKFTSANAKKFMRINPDIVNKTIYGVRAYNTNKFEYVRFSVYRYSNEDRLFGRLHPYYFNPTILADGTESECYIEDKVKMCFDKANTCAAHGDMFFFLTDMHTDRFQNAMQSPSIINYINQRTNIDKLFSGGDVADDSDNTTKELLYAVKTNKVYMADGNHEYRSGITTYNNVFYDQRMHNNDVVFGGDNKNYYYVDNTQQKIRYIFLACYGQGDGSIYDDLMGGAFDESQFGWFSNTALNTEDGYSIVIVLHNLYDITTDKTLGLGSGRARYVSAIIEHNRTSANKVILVLQGHTHCDRIINVSTDESVYKSQTRDNSTIPCIMSTCDKFVPFSGDVSADDRVGYSITEQAVNVVFINTSSRQIDLVRIGAPFESGVGNNVNGDKKEVITLSYPA